MSNVENFKCDEIVISDDALLPVIDVCRWIFLRLYADFMYVIIGMEVGR